MQNTFGRILNFLKRLSLVSHNVVAINFGRFQVIDGQLIIDELEDLLPEFFTMSLRIFFVVYDGLGSLLPALLSNVRVYLSD